MCPVKLKIDHTLPHEEYFLKHCFLDICRCAFNSNRIKSQPYGTLVDEAYSLYNENVDDGQHLFDQTENYQWAKGVNEESNNEKPQKNSNSGLPRFMPTLLANDETFEMIMSLNVKQRTVFDVVQERVRNYGEYKNVNVQSNHIFYTIVVELEN